MYLLFNKIIINLIKTSIIGKIRGKTKTNIISNKSKAIKIKINIIKAIILILVITFNNKILIIKVKIKTNLKETKISKKIIIITNFKKKKFSL